MKELFKTWLIAFSVAGLAACTPSFTDKTDKFTVLPEELKDCKIYEIVGTEGGGRMTVMRCPNSSTTTKVPSGKTSRTAVVID